jgi:hypothetical protein
MPRIPNHQHEDEWDNPEEFDIEHDEPLDRLGRKLPRQEREEELHRREQLQKRYRQDY